ncbi:hypothetical protein HMSSN139_05980 [Paenibacillus sp. HMSSN-139]|nr:hypothetical protein HMSSN139_05980 [Paenibacillus sp. HMSSN-139]
MQKEIDQRLNETKSQVLQNFDIDVQERLKLAKEQAGAFLNRYEHIFWELTKFILADVALFDDANYSFVLTKAIAGCKPGKFDLLSKASDGVPYRLSHPLAQYVINQALELELESGKIVFEQDKNNLKITLPDSLKNKSGYMILSTLDVTAFDNEQYSLFTAYTKTGEFLTQEECEKLFLCAGTVVASNASMDSFVLQKLKRNSEQHVKSKLSEIDSRNLKYFERKKNGFSVGKRT